MKRMTLRYRCDVVPLTNRRQSQISLSSEMISFARSTYLFDVGHILLFNSCNLLILIFLCNFCYFRFREFISLFLSVFNAFQVKFSSYYNQVLIRTYFKIYFLTLYKLSEYALHQWERIQSVRIQVIKTKSVYG